MNLTKEQIHKILELAGMLSGVDIENVSETEITKALVEIERKLNFYDVNVNFKVDNKNILIVDDLELSLYHLNQIMQKVGFRTFVARNKQDALAEILKHNFNYILVDLFLPDANDGFELIKETVELKNSGKQNYKVIVISGTDDKSLIDKCYKLGVDGFVTKTENWHNDILKYFNPMNEHSENYPFNKIVINSEMVLYSIKKLNENKIFEELVADINASILSGRKNVVLNLEKVMVFDVDNTYLFANIYKECQNANGMLLLLNPSEKIKEALAYAFLEGVIPVFHSLEDIIEYVENSKNV